MEIDREIAEGLAAWTLFGVTVLLLALSISGCTTGGYVQVGFIPVSEVSDVHQNRPHRAPAKVMKARQDLDAEG